ncbi:MAG TPA: hypothetical protein VK854_06620 [Woeseiaceae bacterium]|nr:hypothetical protein [Woeseiaceae bacterium]
MRPFLKYSALLAVVAVLSPIDGVTQGRGPGGGGDQAGPRERAQVERGQMDHDRDRMRDRDRIHQPAMDAMQAQDRKQAQQRQQVQEQKQIHVPGTGNGPDSDIYGHELMSVQERNRYREQLQLVQSDPEQKNRFLAQHREQMQARAKAQGVVIGDGGEIEEAE